MAASRFMHFSLRAGGQEAKLIFSPFHAHRHPFAPIPRAVYLSFA